MGLFCYGQKVFFTIENPIRQFINILKHNIEILYEDEGIIAVNKPAGILSIPDRFNADIPNLLHILLQSYSEIIPVHRLDKFTTGVNIFAKNADSHKHLSAQFESGTVGKYYYAIVDGVPSPEEGEINVPLAESQVRKGKMVVNKKGKPSVTLYKVMESYGRYSWIALQLLTGRMHQIRVHMHYIGHPLVVDTLYGKREAFYISDIKTKRLKIADPENQNPLLERQPLHAYAIEFFNPSKDCAMRIEAPMPKDMKACINQLRKWCGEKKGNF